jgi:hypothetical protein
MESKESSLPSPQVSRLVALGVSGPRPTEFSWSAPPAEALCPATPLGFQLPPSGLDLIIRSEKARDQGVGKFPI